MWYFDPRDDHDLPGDTFVNQNAVAFFHGRTIVLLPLHGRKLPLPQLTGKYLVLRNAKMLDILDEV